MATAHLISGLPCSGKSTYAKLLKLQTGAVLFRLDHWLNTLYENYSLDEVSSQKHIKRVLATRDLIWFSSSELLSRGVDVILDDGFFSEEQRSKYISLTEDLGADALVHYINTPIETIESRLTDRNNNLPENTFYISTEKLRFFEEAYEIPNQNDKKRVRVVKPEDFSPEALSGLISQFS